MRYVDLFSNSVLHLPIHVALDSDIRIPSDIVPPTTHTSPVTTYAYAYSDHASTSHPGDSSIPHEIVSKCTGQAWLLTARPKCAAKAPA